MPTIAEIEKLALSLPEAERAQLATNLLRSLPALLLDHDEGYAEANRRLAEYKANPKIGLSPKSTAADLTEEEQKLIDSLPGVLHDDDDGYAEALRRDAEMDADPSACLTMEEFEELMRRRVPYAHEP